MSSRPVFRRGLRIALELLFFSALFLSVRAYTQRGVTRGMAPPISGTTLEGDPISLEQLRGAPVLVHFWATWCGVCRREEGTLEQLSREYRVVTVATQSGDANAVREYMVRRGVQFPVVVDEGGGLTRAFGVRAFPTTFILDADGRIRFVETGYTTSPGLRVRHWLSAILGGG